MITIKTQSAYCHAWGSDKNARRVYGLTEEERQAVKAGQTVIISGCPEYKGITDRRIVTINGRFYTRMPNAQGATE